MAMNIDSSLDEIEKIIPSPKINKNTKDLFSEGEDSKFDLDLKNNNLDSFGDISQINNEEDNSLVIYNNKNSKLPSTNENTENSKKVKKNQSTEEIIKNPKEVNIFHANNIPTNRINHDSNEKKYRILFDKNKKLNINSLREEYNKLKNEDNLEYKPNYNKKYISVFNDNKQKINSNLFLNLGGGKRRQNRNILLNTNNGLEDINLKCNFKTNNNSKKKDNKENNDKIRNIKSQLFEVDTFIFDKNNLKNNKNLFSSVKTTEKTAKEKINDNFWENKLKNKSNINNININNINKKIKEKKFYIFEEYKANLSNNNNFKFHTTKSTIIEYNKINNKRNDINLINRYNKLCEDLLYTEKNNSKINSILSFNKISENNNVEKLDNDFNKVYNMVERKIRQNKIDIKINEENQRYYLKNKNKINKIIPKLLSLSQNENININNRLIKHSNRNNIMNNNLNFIFRNNFNNLNTQINQEEMKPYRKNIKNRINNFILSDFSVN